MKQMELAETPKRLRCSRCKQVKGYTKFSADPRRPTGRFPWCMDCQNEYAKAHRFQDESMPLNGKLCPLDDVPIRGRANRVFCSSRCKERAAALRVKFGLTVAQFRAMVDATGGKCPICTKRPTEWHVDHDHATGRVMGVVCQACNVGALAATYHDGAFIRRLLEYVDTPPSVRIGVDVTVPETAPKRPSQLHRVWGYRKAGVRAVTPPVPDTRRVA